MKQSGCEALAKAVWALGRGDPQHISGGTIVTMIDRHSLQCHNCGLASDHEVLMSTNEFGSPDLDLRPAEMMRSTMETWVQICPHCGYCGHDISLPAKNSAILRSDRYRAALDGEGYPLLARRFLAYAMTLEESDPNGAADAYTWAAWVCDDENRAAQAIECRSKAIQWLRQCKPAEEEEALGIGTVVVDLLRRSGRFAEASSECAALLSRAGHHIHIRDVLEFEQQLIAAGDVAAHTIAESAKPSPRPWWRFW